MAPLQEDRALISMSEVAREHLMTTMCHIAAGCIGTGRKRAPPCIDKPLRVIARSVGRPPRLDFTEIVLSNWDATYPSGGRSVFEDEEAALPSSSRAFGCMLHFVEPACCGVRVLQSAKTPGLHAF